MSVDWTEARVLVIDTCGASGSFALAQGAEVMAESSLPGRAASAQLLAQVRSMLEGAGWEAAELDAVGVVSGPGSFTGVRVGLSAAKGLCEALGVPMGAVSRLEVLEETAGVADAVAVLDAGRGEAYVRDSGREVLVKVEELAEQFRGREIVVAEEALAAKLSPLRVRVVELSAASAVGAVRRCLAEGGTDVALADANYVRGESQIYASKPQAAKA